jgi:hypothetical protein
VSDILSSRYLNLEFRFPEKQGNIHLTPVKFIFHLTPISGKYMLKGLKSTESVRLTPERGEIPDFLRDRSKIEG